MSDMIDSVQSRPDLSEDPGKGCAWQALLDRFPYARHLGLQAQQHDEGMVVALPYRESFIGNFMLPALHGGVLGAVIEIPARAAAQNADEDARCTRIVDSNINYLRSARAVTTFAKASIVRQGGRTSLIEVTCWQENKNRPVTSGRVQLLFTATVAT